MFPRLVLWRQVASHAVCLHATTVVDMFREFPTVLYMGVHMAHHAGFIGREIDRSLIGSDHDTCADDHTQAKDARFAVEMFHYMSID